MSAVDLALPRLKIEEGFRAKPYEDTRGFLTIGYGANLDAGLSEHAAEALLTAQADEMHLALLSYAWYEALDEARQSICLDIAFNAGLHGLVSGFPRMIAALARHDFASAATECHVQNPELAGRYQRLAQMLLIGSVA